MRSFGVTLLAVVIPWFVATSQVRVTSPDGRNQVVVATHDGKLFYAVWRDGRPLLTPSLLGFQFRGQPPLQDSLRIVDSTRSSFDTTWTQPWGEVSRIRDHHNELKVSVAETGPPDRKFTLGPRRVKRAAARVHDSEPVAQRRRAAELEAEHRRSQQRTPVALHHVVQLALVGVDHHDVAAVG